MASGQHQFSSSGDRSQPNRDRSQSSRYGGPDDGGRLPPQGRYKKVLTRCRNYDPVTKELKEGKHCAPDCRFQHPTDPDWDRAHDPKPRSDVLTLSRNERDRDGNGKSFNPPFLMRCRNYDPVTKELKEGKHCPPDCRFQHPTDPGWDRARDPKPRSDMPPPPPRNERDRDGNTKSFKPPSRDQHNFSFESDTRSGFKTFSSSFSNWGKDPGFSFNSAAEKAPDTGGNSKSSFAASFSNWRKDSGRPSFGSAAKESAMETSSSGWGDPTLLDAPIATAKPKESVQGSSSSRGGWQSTEQNSWGETANTTASNGWDAPDPLRQASAQSSAPAVLPTATSVDTTGGWGPNLEDSSSPSLLRRGTHITSPSSLRQRSSLPEQKGDLGWGKQSRPEPDDGWGKLRDRAKNPSSVTAMQDMDLFPQLPTATANPPPTARRPSRFSSAVDIHISQSDAPGGKSKVDQPAESQTPIQKTTPQSAFGDAAAQKPSLKIDMPSFTSPRPASWTGESSTKAPVSLSPFTPFSSTTTTTTLALMQGVQNTGYTITPTSITEEKWNKRIDVLSRAVAVQLESIRSEKSIGDRKRLLDRLQRKAGRPLSLDVNALGGATHSTRSREEYQVLMRDLMDNTGDDARHWWPTPRRGVSHEKAIGALEEDIQALQLKLPAVDEEHKDVDMEDAPDIKPQITEQMLAQKRQDVAEFLDDMGEQLSIAEAFVRNQNDSLDGRIREYLETIYPPRFDESVDGAAHIAELYERFEKLQARIEGFFLELRARSNAKIDRKKKVDTLCQRIAELNAGRASLIAEQEAIQRDARIVSSLMEARPTLADRVIERTTSKAAQERFVAEMMPRLAKILETLSEEDAAYIAQQRIEVKQEYEQWVAQAAIHRKQRGEAFLRGLESHETISTLELFGREIQARWPDIVSVQKVQKAPAIRIPDDRGSNTGA